MKCECCGKDFDSDAEHVASCPFCGSEAYKNDGQKGKANDTDDSDRVTIWELIAYLVCVIGSAVFICVVIDGLQQGTIDGHAVGRGSGRGRGIVGLVGGIIAWGRSLLKRLAKSSFKLSYGWFRIKTDAGDETKNKPNIVENRNEADLANNVSDDSGIIEKLDGNMIPILGTNFAICKYEVTQALWFAVMGERPSIFYGNFLPVENVSWNDCHLFLAKLNNLAIVKASGHVYRLPKQDEWAFACRAGTKGMYCKLTDGSEITRKTLDSVAWYDGNSEDHTHPVGQKTPNAFGLFDMCGNVKEWTSSISGGSAVTCGGSWGSYAGGCEATSSDWHDSDYRSKHIGFRLAYSQG